jgi:hypothetical protein
MASGSAVERCYIRHPSSMPIQFSVSGDATPRRHYLQNVSQAGLSFRSSESLPRGEVVHVRIPVLEQAFEADARVAWCRRSGTGEYEVGLEFVDPGTEFAMRMVEQVCHIEAYRKRALREQGRELSSEAAAEEWVARYAAGFPRTV